MTPINQSDPSPCCNVKLLVFPSGGSRLHPKIKGAYVMCAQCYKEYEIHYQSGNIKDGQIGITVKRRKV